MRSASAFVRLAVCAGALLGPAEVLVGCGGVALAGEASAPKDWKQEFEDVCSKTQDAMALSVPELKSLVSRCDALKPAIEALDEPLRKVYGRRLQACRELYQYVLDYREQKGEKS